MHVEHLKQARSPAWRTNVEHVLLNRDVRNRFLKIRFGFSLVFEKNSDSVVNEFGTVPFKKLGSDIIVIYYSGNSKYYNDSG